MTLAQARETVVNRPYLFTRLWSILTISIICLLILGFYRSVAHAQVSTAQHNDLLRRVDKLEQIQSQHEQIISRNTQRIADIGERLAKMDNVDMTMTQGHEMILERVTKMETITNENQMLLRGVGIGIMLLLFEMLGRTIFRKGLGIGVKEGVKPAGDD